MFMMAVSFSSNRLDVRGRLAAPCCRSRRPRQTTREPRVVGLGYVKWSAEQADISAANSLILTQPKLVQVKPTLVTFPTFPRTLAAESSMGGLVATSAA